MAVTGALAPSDLGQGSNTDRGPWSASESPPVTLVTDLEGSIGGEAWCWGKAHRWMLCGAELTGGCHVGARLHPLPVHSIAGPGKTDSTVLLSSEPPSPLTPST